MDNRLSKNLIKILCIAMALSICIGVFEPSAFADPNTRVQEEELDDIEASIKELQNDLKSGKTTATKIQNEITELGTQISQTTRRINTITRKVNDTKAQISQSLAELEQLEANMADQTDDINSRIRALYKNGDIGMLAILLGSKSMSELLTNMEMAKRLYKSDEKLLEDLQLQYDAVYQKKLELTALKESLTQQQDELNEKRASLSSDKATLAVKKAAVDNDNKELEKQLDALQAEADRLVEEIKKLQGNGAYAGGKMCWPSKASTRVTSKYGYRLHPILKVNKLHTGIDIGAAKGTDILAANDGTVITAAYNAGGYGYYVMVDHGGGVVTLYAHASKLLVKKGDKVKRGQTIALVGSTGMSTGAHLHFEIRINGAYQDPLNTKANYYVVPGVY